MSTYGVPYIPASHNTGGGSMIRLIKLIVLFQLTQRAPLRISMFHIINALTGVRLPYSFDTQAQAQAWIDAYRVSPTYKQNYRIV